MRVLALSTDRASEVRSAVDVLGASSAGAVLHASRGERINVFAEDGALDEVVGTAHEREAIVGISPTGELGQARTLVESALHALYEAVRTGTTMARFEDVVGRGVLGALCRSDAHLVAASMLEPLDAHDATHGTALRAWLERDCSWQDAAARLEVHRHTLRARVAHAGALLGLDLDHLDGRLEAWAALRLASAPQGSISELGSPG